MTRWQFKTAFVLIAVLIIVCGCTKKETENSGEIVLRIANMEEYIDEGRWDETLVLANGTEIGSEKGMIADFEKWYENTYGRKVRIEYAAVGTNEELYNLMSLGNTFDLICPSEYMALKLMEEGRLAPFTEDFKDISKPQNYYIRGVSPFIENTLAEMSIGNKQLIDYMAGYMWGSMGLIYNPAKVSEKDVQRWSVLCDHRFYRETTMKDGMRDALFAGLCIKNEDLYCSSDFISSKDYRQQLANLQNDTSPATLKEVEDILSDMRNNAFAIETDSAKADLVSQKANISLQWSGDAVYILDEAEETGLELCYGVPEGCTNLWFDGWVIMKNGIAADLRKQQAAEAFINFISRPDNVIRNMYYIGYTSVIAGGENEDVLEYLKYCYEAKDDKTDVADYDLSYFFGNGDAIIITSADQMKRQLFAQYPTKEVINRAVVMRSFDEEARKRVAQMWINIRCFDIRDLPGYFKTRTQ